MHRPDGNDSPNISKFIQVAEKRADRLGHTVGNEDDPGAQFDVTWIFNTSDDKGKLKEYAMAPACCL
jgi:hypothetical protein